MTLVSFRRTLTRLTKEITYWQKYQNISQQQRWDSTLASSSSSSSSSLKGKSLAELLADSIKARGPMSVSAYMRTCLLDPNQGYYTRQHDILGSRGDFITSPEISQVFGELLAIFFIARWQTVTPTSPSRLIELGPGRGTLLADMIRTFARFKKFFDSLKSIHLVEASPGMMSMQHDALRDALKLVGKRIAPADQEMLEEDEIRIEWFPLVDLVPIQNDTWTMVVAHEFFDALPIHVFERSTDGFREVMIDLDRGQSSGGVTVLKASDLQNSLKTKDPRFRYVLSPSPTPWSMLLAARNPRFQSLQPGQRLEVSPESWAAARKIGELISGRKGKQGKPDVEKDEDRIVREQNELKRQQGNSVGGAGLIIDYGDMKAFGNSFRAFKSHKIVDPLLEPGLADLTCNVDFAYLKTAIDTTDSKSLPQMFQSHFLQALGLDQRIKGLIQNATSEDRSKEIQSSANRLIDPNGMGAQYKIFGIDSQASKDGQELSPRLPCYPFEMQEEIA